MTAQSSEVLILDGHATWMNSLPLDDWLKPRGIHMRALSDGYRTSLYRGYLGLWEIHAGQLFLIGLLDFMDEPFDIGKIFGAMPLPIHAQWFSGRIEIDQGEALSYFHMGWGHSHAELLRLYLQDGRVVARRRYDQTKVLKRRFANAMAADPNLRRELAERGRSPLGPLGGFTQAGLRAIGMPELEHEDGYRPWSGGWTDDETLEFVEARLVHCVRPPEAPPLSEINSASAS